MWGNGKCRIYDHVSGHIYDHIFDGSVVYYSISLRCGIMHKYIDIVLFVVL